MRSLTDGLNLHRLGYTLNTFTAPAYALGSGEERRKGTRRFMIDFAGGEMPYFLKEPNLVQMDTQVTGGKFIRQFLVPNPALQGFRVMIDVELSPDDHTWNWSWKVYNL
jgi:glucans biosynthesis protein